MATTPDAISLHPVAMRGKVERRYPESPEKAGEYLRRALALMSKQDAGVHPISYAVWYEYVSGGNVELNAQIDAILQKGRKLDEDTTRNLHEKYVADLDVDRVQRLGDDLRRVLNDVSDSTSVVNAEAGMFGRNLERSEQRLASTTVTRQEFEGIVETTATETQQMRTTVDKVRTRLSASQEEIDSLRQELARVREESMADGLTGLLNRKGLDACLEKLLESAGDRPDSFAVVMLDIDHFKRINDGYGHLFGDRVIRAVGTALKAGVKGKDHVARYGGEEFSIVLPETPLAGAWAVAEGVRRLVAASRIRRLNNDEVVGNITVSAGVALHRSRETLQSLLARADAALYRAKENGRNRVETAP